MNEWQGWTAAGLGFLLTIAGFNYKAERQRAENARAELRAVTQRVTKLESELLTEREMRGILKEQLAPFLGTLETLSAELIEVRLQLARLGNETSKL